MCECRFTWEDLEMFMECGILPLGASKLKVSDTNSRDDIKKKMIEQVEKNQNICDKHKKELIQNIISS